MSVLDELRGRWSAQARHKRRECECGERGFWCSSCGDYECASAKRVRHGEMLKGGMPHGTA